MRHIAILLLFPTIGAAQEVSIKVDQLPAAIRSAVMKRFPGAPLLEAARETEDGKTFYEVTIRLNGKKVDVTATPGAQLTLVEREISRKDLPAAVITLINGAYPKARYNIVEDVSTVSPAGETLSYYEVLLTDSKNVQWEVQVALDGSKVLKTEQKKPGDVD